MDVIETEVLFRPMKRIALPAGDVLHGIKKSDTGFESFGEAYFSYIHHQAIKAWKLHTRYTVNFVCPLGKVKVVFYKDQDDDYPKEILLSEEAEHYGRVTVPPGIWYGFQGLGKNTNLIFSFLNGEHSLDEQLSQAVNAIPYTWNIGS